ncbi:hypothetical protein HKCCSP123_13860 [Rhodobacterales bacterium HKCCSP123]|nr:hypothetical protein [Rhodobacterales bacterium HKCCSP123]
MRSEPGGPHWDDPFSTPLEKTPDTNNPWASCAGGGSSGGSKPLVDPPEIPPEWLEGSVGFDRDRYNDGFTFVLMGLSSLAAGAALAAYGVAVAIAGGPVGIAVVAVTLGGILVAFGAALALGGVGAMNSAVDPVVLRYDWRATQPPRVSLKIPADTPTPLVNLLLTGHEFRHLSQGEVQLYDLARAAAEKKDQAWYETHMRDLWAVQNSKARVARALADNLDAVATEFEDVLKNFNWDSREPMRNVFNPISDMRSQLHDLGVSGGEIDLLLQPTRIIDPVARHTHSELRKVGEKFDGDGAALLRWVAGGLREMDMIDRQAFPS